jgi:hypothetical protein
LPDRAAFICGCLIGRSSHSFIDVARSGDKRF